MNKVSLLAASVALALTGCGGSDDSGSSATPAPSGITMTAIDGYLQNAEIWVDTNDNLILDASNDKKLSTTTDVNGKFILPAEYKGHAVFIKAIKDKTIDSTRGLVTKNFELATTAGATVVNPMTNMVVDQLAVPGNLLTQEEAEKKVVDSVTESGLVASPELVFGDYVADSSEAAKALNVIGETLVDNSALTVEKQLVLTNAVSDEAKVIIDNNADNDPSNDKDLNELSPVVVIPDDGSPITVTPNSRPIVDTPLEPITLEQGSAWIDINTSDHFSDADIDNDTLTFSFAELKGPLNGLKIDSVTGIISGLPTAAGVFNYQVFAEDVHGSLSYPLNLKVTVQSPNIAPRVNESEIAPLQADIDVWQLIQGQQPTASINISSLFTDADNDTLTYRADSTLTVDNDGETGFEVWIDKEGNISFDGPIPRAAKSGVERLYVWAKDSVNAEEAVHSFTFPQIEETAIPPVDTHPLENKNWYVLERGSSDGDSDYDNDFSRVWCDTYRFEDGKVLSNVRTLANKQTCSETGLIQEESGKYKVDGENIIVTFILEEENNEGIVEEITETATISIKDDTNAPIDEISEGAKAIIYTNSGDKEGQFEYSSAIYFANKADAEKRINVLSSDSPEVRDAPIYWPGEKDGEYVLRSTSLQMNVADEKNSSDKITVWINGVSCDGLFPKAESDDLAIFERFFVTSNSISADSVSPDGSYNAIYANEWFCFTSMEGEGEVKTPSAAISLIFSSVGEQLNIDESYSIMGVISDDWSEFISDINFNMTWDGKTNNE